MSPGQVYAEQLRGQRAKLIHEAGEPVKPRPLTFNERIWCDLSLFSIEEVSAAGVVATRTIREHAAAGLLKIDKMRSTGSNPRNARSVVRAPELRRYLLWLVHDQSGDTAA